MKNTRGMVAIGSGSGNLACWLATFPIRNQTTTTTTNTEGNPNINKSRVVVVVVQICVPAFPLLAPPPPNIAPLAV